MSEHRSEARSAAPKNKPPPPKAASRSEGALALLSGRLGIPTPPEAMPDAAPGARPRVLLRTADGWFHPGPEEVRPDFERMVSSLGGDVGALGAETLDQAAGLWRLPAAAVRPRRRRPPMELPELTGDRLGGATVVVLGAMWAVPLAALVLAQLGARVVRVHHPTRPDAFVLREQLARGQEHVHLDLSEGGAREQFIALSSSADALVDGNTPRVLRNLGLVPDGTQLWSVTALRDDDRPGYGAVAECRGGWAARTDPPWLGRTSVADPVTGLLVALRVAAALAEGRRGTKERISLEDGVELAFG